MTRSAHTLGRWVEEGIDQLLRSGSEYVTEEALVVASAYDIENFCANVDKLRDQLARLEKRTEALER
jgi:ubiquinone biosynthesis protein UbiJ